MPQTRTLQKSQNFDIIFEVSHQKVHPWKEHKKWVYIILRFVWICKSAFLADFGISLRFLASARNSLRRYVGPSVGSSVGRLVGPLHLFSIAEFAVLRLAETYYCPCPTARN